MRTAKLTPEAHESFYQRVVRQFDALPKPATLESLEALLRSFEAWRTEFKVGRIAGKVASMLVTIIDDFYLQPKEPTEGRKRVFNAGLVIQLFDLGQAMNKVIETHRPKGPNVRNRIAPTRIYGRDHYEKDSNGNKVFVSEQESWLRCHEEIEQLAKRYESRTNQDGQQTGV